MGRRGLFLFRPARQLVHADSVQQLQHVHLFIAAGAFHFQAVVLLALEQVLLCEELRHGCRAAAFAVARDTFVNLVPQAMEGVVQGIQIRGDDAEQRLAFRPTGAQFDLAAIRQQLYQHRRGVTLKQHAGNPGHLRVAYKTMQPDRQAADHALGHEVIAITQH